MMSCSGYVSSTEKRKESRLRQAGMRARRREDVPSPVSLDLTLGDLTFRGRDAKANPAGQPINSKAAKNSYTPSMIATRQDIVNIRAMFNTCSIKGRSWRRAE